MSSLGNVLYAAFQSFDTNHSGQLTRGELSAILSRGASQLSEEDINEILEDFDVNEDGTLSLDEFCDAMVSVGMAQELAAKGFTPDYTHADPSRWTFETIKPSTGRIRGTWTKLERKEMQGTVAEGLELLRQEPGKYIALQYPTSMEDPSENWVVVPSYTMILREGIIKFHPAPAIPNRNVTIDNRAVVIKRGQYTMVVAHYEPRPKLSWSSAYSDSFSDTPAFLTYRNSPLRLICPGRGEGACDIPGIKLMGNIDPGDIDQSGVGNCWLLAVLSALAEFDGFIRHLFRKTPNLDQLPLDGPNKYTITLWDLPTMKEVDIVVDERLAARKSGGLLSCQPTKCGELWACYIEKACVAHVGSWDKIRGNLPSHGMMLLTGCKWVYNLEQKSDRTWKCYGHYCPHRGGYWEKLNNQDPPDLWPMDWPEVGGGGHSSVALSADEMFKRLVAWDQANYLICPYTDSLTKKMKVYGMIPNHAYTILRVLENVAGSGQNLIKVRNPHMRNEFKFGKWTDNGRGWKDYPAVKEELQPLLGVDNGTFWLDYIECFILFSYISLCAKDMSKYKTESDVIAA